MKHATLNARMFFLSLLLSLCFFENIKTTDEKKEIWVTIFVHGIMSIQPYLSPGLICKLFNDSIENTLYADVVYKIRKNTLFSCQNFI